MALTHKLLSMMPNKNLKKEQKTPSENLDITTAKIKKNAPTPLCKIKGLIRV
jgi:hypothetical protein